MVTVPTQKGTIRFESLVLPVLGVESVDERLARLRLVDIGPIGERTVPIFCSEATFLAHRPAGSDGLILEPDRLMQVLRPDDVVILDPGTPQATRWTMPELAGLLLAIASFGEPATSERRPRLLDRLLRRRSGNDHHGPPS
jgi:hypothetical protein